MAKIEVEKKFNFDQADLDEIKSIATLEKKIKIIDNYLDNQQYDLTLKDMWLRSRSIDSGGGEWELKVPQNKGVSILNRDLDRYKEITSEEEIIQILNLSGKASFAQILRDNGYKIFAPIVTERQKYKFRDFSIDIDQMNEGLSIAEIELLVDRDDEVENAKQRIFELANKLNLTIEPVEGKVIQYIKFNNLNHYRALVKAGVV